MDGLRTKPGTKLATKTSRTKTTRITKKKKRILKKIEKETISSAIVNLEDAELIAAILYEVDHAAHISVFPERAQLWEKLKVSDLMVMLCKCLKKVYLSIYTDCGTGSDKYARFQFKWYQTCSLLLLDTLTDGCEYHSCLSETFHKLVEFRSNYTTSMHDSNALIIAVQGACHTHPYTHTHTHTQIYTHIRPSTHTHIPTPTHTHQELIEWVREHVTPSTSCINGCIYSMDWTVDWTGGLDWWIRLLV